MPGAGARGEGCDKTGSPLVADYGQITHDARLKMVQCATAREVGQLGAILCSTQ